MGTRDGQTAALLAEACARNSSIELQYDAPGGETMVAKSRILGLDGDHLFLDHPQSIGKVVEFKTGQAIDAYLVLADTRYAFRSLVTELGCIVEINDRKRVVGIVIRRPANIRPGQRRSGFRVGLLGVDAIEPRLHTAIADDRGICPVDAHVFTATLVNLSIGGAGLRVDRADGVQLKLNDPLFMTFFLPGEEEEFYFLTEVRQTRPIDGENAMRAGLKIKAWPTRRDLERTQQRLQRYITEVQRRKLRRAG